jgi:hypothetical protein
LEAEILILRHQLNIQRRHQPKRLAVSAMHRVIFVWLYRLLPNTIKALTIVKPDTVIRWHRVGFRLYWRWKTRHGRGRPAVPLAIRRLIREMSQATDVVVGVRLGDGTQLRDDLQPDRGTEAALVKHANGVLAHQDIR